MSAQEARDSDGRLSEVASLFVQAVDEGQRTAYRQEVNRFLRWFGAARMISEVSALDLERYQEEAAASKVDRKHASDALRSLFSFARQEGIITVNPAKHLRTTRLPQIMDDLKTAYADKDFRENAPYDAAKLEKGKVEGRMKELEEILKRAVIRVAAADAGDKVSLGSTVTVIEVASGDEVTYTIVDPREASPLKGRISTESAVGKSLLGHRSGAEVDAKTPMGTVRYRITMVSALK